MELRLLCVYMFSVELRFWCVCTSCVELRLCMCLYIICGTEAFVYVNMFCVELRFLGVCMFICVVWN